MANKREKLESRAKELGLTFVPSTTDDELQQLINDFQNDDKSDADLKYFKTSIAGLQIQIGDEPARDEQAQMVRFSPYKFFDEENGEHFVVGLLETDEQDAIEVMADDPNVEEITKAEYDEFLEKGEKTRL